MKGGGLLWSPPDGFSTLTGHEEVTGGERLGRKRRRLERCCGVLRMGTRSILQLLSPFVALLAWVGLVLLLNSNGVIPLREGWADVVVPSTTTTVEIILEGTRSAEPPDTGSLDGGGALGTDSRETPTDAKVTPSVEEPVEEQVYVVKEGDSPYSISYTHLRAHET